MVTESIFVNNEGPTAPAPNDDLSTQIARQRRRKNLYASAMLLNLTLSFGGPMSLLVGPQGWRVTGIPGDIKEARVLADSTGSCIRDSGSISDLESCVDNAKALVDVFAQAHPDYGASVVRYAEVDAANQRRMLSVGMASLALVIPFGIFASRMFSARYEQRKLEREYAMRQLRAGGDIDIG